MENAIRACIYCARLRESEDGGQSRGEQRDPANSGVETKGRKERDDQLHCQNTATALSSLSIIIVGSKPTGVHSWW